MNTEDQVKTAKPSRPDILLLSRYDGRCNIRHQDTRIQTPSGWGSQDWRQDAVDKGSHDHGRVNLIISGYRGGLDIYKGPSPPDETLSLNTLLHLSPHDDTRIYNVSRDTGSVLSVNVLSRIVSSLFELLNQNIRCTQPNILRIFLQKPKLHISISLEDI